MLEKWKPKWKHLRQSTRGSSYNPLTREAPHFRKCRITRGFSALTILHPASPGVIQYKHLADCRLTADARRRRWVTMDWKPKRKHKARLSTSADESRPPVAAPPSRKGLPRTRTRASPVQYPVVRAGLPFTVVRRHTAFYYTHLLWRRRALSIPGLIDCSAKQHEAME
jgi:hypothetical protein